MSFRLLLGRYWTHRSLGLVFICILTWYHVFQVITARVLDLSLPQICVILGISVLAAPITALQLTEQQVIYIIACSWRDRNVLKFTNFMNRILYFRTPDQDFPCFYPCEIILSHTPVPALGKDKKWIAACHPHAGRTSICDVIVMLKWHHHVAWSFFMSL